MGTTNKPAQSLRKEVLSAPNVVVRMEDTSRAALNMIWIRR